MKDLATGVNHGGREHGRVGVGGSRGGVHFLSRDAPSAEGEGSEEQDAQEESCHRHTLKGGLRHPFLRELALETIGVQFELAAPGRGKVSNRLHIPFTPVG
jgi:hypothetical protein